MDDRFPIIRGRMPELEQGIDEVLRAGENLAYYDDFLEACEDYEACQRALCEPSLKEYAEEFRTLSGEIEQEIRRYLERYAGSFDPTSTPGRSTRG